MDIEHLKSVAEAWLLEAAPGACEKGHCPICAPISRSTQEGVSALMKKLVLLAAVGMEEALFRCPLCGQLWGYRSWMERPDWGQCMEGITEPYEEEALYKRDAGTVRSWMEKILAEDPENLAPAGEGGKSCPRCGRPFICAGNPSCWCMGLSLSTPALERIAGDFKGCLCPSCLAEFADAAGAGSGP